VYVVYVMCCVVSGVVCCCFDVLFLLFGVVFCVV